MREAAPWIMGPALLLLCGGLLWWQLRGDPAAKDEADEDSVNFFRRQWWRRLQVAVLIGIVGLAIMVGPWITAPLAAGLFWLGVLVIVVWIGILGLIDLWAGRERLETEERRMELERTEIVAQFDQQTRAMRSKRTTGANGDGK